MEIENDIAMADVDMAAPEAAAGSSSASFAGAVAAASSSSAAIDSVSGSSAAKDAAPVQRKRVAEDADSRARRATEVERQLQSIKSEQARGQKARLRFLLGQSDLFRHFLEEGGAPKDQHDIDMMMKSPQRDGGGAGAGSSSSTAATKSPARRGKAAAGAGKKKGKKDEVDDDEENDDEMARPPTRLTVQPKVISGTQMRDYQLEGLNWMIGLHEHGLNGILADEMGLGKTLQTISLLGWCLESLGNTGPHLVLVPKSTLSNWEREIARFCPALKTVTLHGDKEQRAGIIADQLLPGLSFEERGWHVLLTTYEVAGIEENALVKVPWQYLVIDEAHRIKNEESSLSYTVRRLVTAHRLLITGTPLQNNLHELWALLNFLLPDVFGSSEAFDRWFNLQESEKDEESKANTVRQLHRVLRPFMLRRLKVDVAKALPPKKETLLYVGMSKMQKELYKSILMRNIDTVLAERGGGDKTRLANLIMHLRKAVAHPYLFDGMEDRTLDPLGEHLIENCAKLKLLDKLLPKLQAKGSRVLIFSQMTSLLDIIEDYCHIRDYDYCRIDGNKSYDEREESIDAFNAPGSKKFVFLLSTRAGGLGINLATADIVILYDSDWNPQADLQAQDRAHRIGQTKPVQVYRLITQGSVEEKMIERAMIKLKLDAVVVQQGRLSDKSKAVSKEEMMEMIQFGANAVFKSGDKDDITDADIDAILAAGEAKTKDMQDAVASKVGGGNGLLDFKMEAGSAQFFEGVDYSSTARKEAEKAKQKELKLKLLSAQSHLMSGQDRAAKTGRVILSYNEKLIFKALAQADSAAAFGAGNLKDKEEAKRLRNLLPLDHRPPPRMDPWTLLDKDRIMEITAMEISWAQQRETMEKAGALPAASSAGAASSSASSAAAGAGGDVIVEIDATKPFPQELIDERAYLISLGFPDWRKDDYDAFVNACRRFGRGDVDSIARALAQKGKDPMEIARYTRAFWSVGHKFFPAAVWNGILKKVRRGEGQLREMKTLEISLAAKISRFSSNSEHIVAAAAAAGGQAPKDASEIPQPDPWNSLPMPQTAALRSYSWSPEADRYILCAIQRLGHGRYDAIRAAIMHEPRFRFDFWLRARTPEDISTRARQLLRATEKDMPTVVRDEAKILAEKAEVEAEMGRKRSKEVEVAKGSIGDIIRDAVQSTDYQARAENAARLAEIQQIQREHEAAMQKAAAEAAAAERARILAEEAERKERERQETIAKVKAAAASAAAAASVVASGTDSSATAAEQTGEVPDSGDGAAAASSASTPAVTVKQLWELLQKEMVAAGLERPAGSSSGAGASSSSSGAAAAAASGDTGKAGTKSKKRKLQESGEAGAEPGAAGATGGEGADGKKLVMVVRSEATTADPGLFPCLVLSIQAAGGTGIDKITAEFCEKYKGAAGVRPPNKRQIKALIDVLAVREAAGASKDTTAAGDSDVAMADGSGAAAHFGKGTFKWTVREMYRKYATMTPEEARAEYAESGPIIVSFKEYVHAPGGAGEGDATATGTSSKPAATGGMPSAAASTSPTSVATAAAAMLASAIALAAGSAAGAASSSSAEVGKKPSPSAGAGAASSTSSAKPSIAISGSIPLPTTVPKLSPPAAGGASKLAAIPLAPRPAASAASPPAPRPAAPPPVTLEGAALANAMAALAKSNPALLKQIEENARKAREDAAKAAGAGAGSASSSRPTSPSLLELGKK